MALQREASLGVGLATAAMVWGVYQAALPSVVDERVSQPGDAELASTERAATWTAAAIVSGVSLIAKDPTVFVIGGIMVIGLAFWHRHANYHSASTGMSVVPSSRAVQDEQLRTGAGYTPSA